MNINGQKTKAILLSLVMVIGGMIGLLVPGGGHASAFHDRWEALSSPGFTSGEASNLSTFMDEESGTLYVAYRDMDHAGYATVKWFNGSGWETIGNAGFSDGQVTELSLFVFDGTPYVAYRDQANHASVMKYDSYGEEWVPVGDPDISAGAAGSLSLQVKGNEGPPIPIIAYRDETNGNKATVKIFNFFQDKWETAGEADISDGAVDSLSLERDETLFVAYSDQMNGGKATVKAFNGYDWDTVGGDGFSVGEAAYPSLQVNYDTPYVAYSDAGNSGKVSVQKWNGSSWGTVGGADISAGAAAYTSLQVYYDTLYVAYSDAGNSGKVSVKKFNGGSWEAVGGAGISAGAAKYISLRVYDGIPYVAYIDEGKSGQITIMKLETGGRQSWEAVGGTGFSEAGAFHTSLQVYDGTPYIAYSDGSFGDLATVLKYDGGSWVAVGRPQFSASGVDYISLYVYEGTPYVAYSDRGQSGRATVMKYNADANRWETVGNAGFSEGKVDSGLSLYVYEGTPYVFYQDADHNGIGKVMKYHSESDEWQMVGGAVSDSHAYYTSLYVDDGTPYAAFRDESNSYKVTVKKYNADEDKWETVGKNDISADQAYYTSLYVDNGIPYVAFEDYGNSDKATVMKYSAGQEEWEMVGGAGASEGSAEYISLHVDNGTPYVAYLDNSTGKSKATVKKYNGSGWETVGMARFSAGEVDDISLYVYDGIPYVAYRDSASPFKATVMKHKYVVTFDGNGGSGGTIERGYDKNEIVTVPDNIGNLTKAGFTFVGWNTAADGSGTGYTSGQTFVIGTDELTLYAQWLSTSGSGGGDGNVGGGGDGNVGGGDDGNVGGGGDGNVGSGGDGNLGPVISEDGKLTLPVGRAGEVSLDHALFISIPSGAISKQLEITIEKLLNTQILFNHQEIPSSPVYEVRTNIPERFIKPVTLTIQFDTAKAKSGQTVAIFCYDELQKIWVKVEGGKVSGNRISADIDHVGKFTVLVVDEKTGLAATEQTVEFSDISGHWAEAIIKQAVREGIVTGYPDGTFKPNGKVSRAEFAVMLMNTLKPQAEGATLTFTDTSKIGAWAKNAVAQAVQAGIISGYPDGSFRPDANITRAEMAVMIARALSLSVESNIATDFADDKDIPSWAKGATAAIKKLGIVEGKGSNAFDPDGKTTRAEAVTVITKVLAQKSK